MTDMITGATEAPINSIENQYAIALMTVKTHGIREVNRTGIDTVALQHGYFKYPGNQVPVLRAKKMYPYMALKEVVWMMLGRTDVEWLHENGVTYWDEWVLEDGTVGKTYGYQYRNFNGIDQLAVLVHDMNTNPMSRRHIINLWNVNELSEMALPPCMFQFQFCCIPNGENKYIVDLHALQRSADMFLGVPYDFIFNYWMLNLVVYYLNHNELTNGQEYTVGNIHHTTNNTHIYVNHFDAVDQYLWNVTENKNGVVGSDYTATIDFGDKVYANIDEFLADVESELKNKPQIHIKVNKEKEDVYDKIVADIAV